MDDLDRQILRLLAENARMPVKDIAQSINLTSPAVSSRIRRLEKDRIIAGYTVVLNPPDSPTRLNALVSVSTSPASHDGFLAAMETEPEVLKCYRVTGSASFMVHVSCEDIYSLEHLVTKLQKFGSTNTQIVLSTNIDRQQPI